MADPDTRLFVIADPTADHQFALIKGLMIAKLANCAVHVFLCTYRDIEESVEYSSRQDFKHHVLRDAEQWLAGHLEAFDLAGVAYTSEVVWNSRWYESALRAIPGSDCSLVIKSSFHHGKARRVFGKTSDYSLMRGSPVPVLFVQADQEWKTNRVLACVDLESEDPRHARLNDLIAGAARAVAGALGMEIYLASAYADRLNLTGMRVEGRAPEAAVDIIAEHFGIDPARVHLRRTETVSALEALCAELAPSILVMGTLARTGIKGKLIGNTAEKLLDVVNADILTVS